MCDKILPYVPNIVIDGDKNHILTNYKAVKYGGKAIDSDHFTLYLDLNLKWEHQKPERQIMFNFKNKQAQMKFKEATSITTEFTDCFTSNYPLNLQIQVWRRLLDKFIKLSFDKIRIRKKQK